MHISCLTHTHLCLCFWFVTVVSVLSLFLPFHICRCVFLFIYVVVVSALCVIPDPLLGFPKCHWLIWGGSSSGGREGWLVTARLLVQSLDPPGWASRCPWARHLTLTAPDELAVTFAWLSPPSLYEWVIVRQYCKAHWVATGYRKSAI